MAVFRNNHVVSGFWGCPRQTSKDSVHLDRPIAAVECGIGWPGVLREEPCLEHWKNVVSI